MVIATSTPARRIRNAVSFITSLRSPSTRSIMCDHPAGEPASFISYQRSDSPEAPNAMNSVAAIEMAHDMRDTNMSTPVS